MGMDRGVITKCNHDAGIDLCGKCQLKNKIITLEKQNLQFREMIDMARNEYLELNSDGEHDCVTPYDIHT